MQRLIVAVTSLQLFGEPFDVALLSLLSPAASPSSNSSRTSNVGAEPVSQTQPFLAEHNAALITRVQLLFAAQAIPAFRRIVIEAQQGHVTLRGALASYYHRQLAVALVRRIAGVIHVIDQLDVIAPPLSTNVTDVAFIALPA
jgi:hypothetical protein